MRTCFILSTAVLVLPLSACSFSASIGSGRVPADKLESRVSDALAAQVGETLDEVDCPDALDAEVDATTRCVLTNDGVSYGLTVTVTEVHGSDIEFDYKVDLKPTEDA